MKRFYLREWRTLRGHTQDELAELASVDQGTITAIETYPDKNRHGRTIAKLARALQVTAKDLEREPRSDEWIDAASASPINPVIEEFRTRGGQGLTFEERESLRSRLAEEINRKRAERMRLQRIQELEEEERELERLKKDLESNRKDEDRG